MKLVISPAKSLDFETSLPTTRSSQALFLQKSERIQKLLKKKSAKSLSKLMGISDALGKLNYERNQSWQLPFNSENSRQAIYAFNGDVYRGLQAYTISEDKLDNLQDTVRILSGLYGVLKPLDLIQAYRLEMGTTLPIGTQKNLYQFWSKTLTKALNEELDDNELFLNLASQEYFKVIDTKKLKVPVIHVDFKDLIKGNYKTIGIFAKMARGLMTRYILDTHAKTLEDIKGFHYEGYGFSEPMSKHNTLVFIR